MKNNKVIYASWFGATGGIIEPEVITEGWDYHFYTDHEELLSLNTKWNVQYMRRSSEETDSELRAKSYKILAHCFYPFPTYTHSIYIDSDKYKIDCNLDELLERSLEEDSLFASLKHRASNCTYQEIERQRKRGKDSEESFQKIKERCLSARLPEKWGLNDNSIIIRKHCSKVSLFNNSWWLEVVRYCKRDQCSLMKLLYQTDIKFNQLHYEGYKNYKALRYLSKIKKEG